MVFIFFSPNSNYYGTHFKCYQGIVTKKSKSMISSRQLAHHHSKINKYMTTRLIPIPQSSNQQPSLLGYAPLPHGHTGGQGWAKTGYLARPTFFPVNRSCKIWSTWSVVYLTCFLAVLASSITLRVTIKGDGKYCRPILGCHVIVTKTNHKINTASGAESNQTFYNAADMWTNGKTGEWQNGRMA